MKTVTSLVRSFQFIWNHPISSKNRFSAYGRFLRWQVACRLLRHPVLLPFVGNSHLVVEKSMTGATGNFYCGLHEFSDMAFLLHFLRSEDLFLDAGANIGSYSVLASGVVGAKTIAAEPVPETFKKLQRNLRSNELDCLVDAKCVALGDRRGELRFSTDRDTINQVVGDCYPGRSQLVQVMPIDELLEGKSAILWKVDVEGFEQMVLKGATRSLQNPRLCAILLESDSEEIASIMQGAGFARYQYDAHRRRLTTMSDTAQKSSEILNNLWIRNHELVAERCVSSQRFNILGVEF